LIRARSPCFPLFGWGSGGKNLTTPSSSFLLSAAGEIHKDVPSPFLFRQWRVSGTSARFSFPFFGHLFPSNGHSTGRRKKFFLCCTFCSVPDVAILSLFSDFLSCPSFSLFEEKSSSKKTLFMATLHFEAPDFSPVLYVFCILFLERKPRPSARRIYFFCLSPSRRQSRGLATSPSVLPRSAEAIRRILSSTSKLITTTAPNAFRVSPPPQQLSEKPNFRPPN